MSNPITIDEALKQQAEALSAQHLAIVEHIKSQRGTCDGCKHWGPNVAPASENRKVKINGQFAMGACRNPLLNHPICHLDEEPSAAGPDTAMYISQHNATTAFWWAFTTKRAGNSATCY